MPILVRPVREQLEHDRVIRLLQAKLKRRHDVAINVGDEKTTGIKVGVGQMFPDLVLTSVDRGHRLEGIVEVETGESVNHLEAMAQWAHFGRTRAPFHLYVPAVAVEIARRLLTENHVDVAELWSYHTIGDQTRFTLVQRATTAGPTRAPAAAAVPRKAAPAAAPSPARSRKPAPPPRKAAPATRPAKGRAASRSKTVKSARTQKRK
ncbi:MAG: hypothetical protein DMF86_23460 [Acidobacteria bacterium]|nr:MAG: hypothetical protein DMF86_23460 [Acidobacteriota bacterium]